MWPRLFYDDVHKNNPPQTSGRELSQHLEKQKQVHWEKHYAHGDAECSSILKVDGSGLEKMENINLNRVKNARSFWKDGGGTEGSAISN